MSDAAGARGTQAAEGAARDVARTSSARSAIGSSIGSPSGWRRMPGRAGDARRIAGPASGGRWARSGRFRRRAPTPASCWRGGRRCCSTTRCSTAIRASSATSPRARRRSACSATSWRPRSTRTWARGSWRPLATEIEGQAVRWIAELIGFPTDCGGLLVSGGNMANFVCFLAARAAKAPWDVRKEGLAREAAAAGLCVDGDAQLDQEGRRHVRPRHRRDPLDRHRQPGSGWTWATFAGRSRRTSALGHRPFLVVGTAGSVSTGAVDPLAGDRGHLPRAWIVVSRGRRLRRAGRAGRGRAGEPARAERGRFGRRRSPQVALRAARGRLRAGARRPRSCATPSRITRPTTTSTMRS